MSLRPLCRDSNQEHEDCDDVDAAECAIPEGGGQMLSEWTPLTAETIYGSC